LSTVHTVAPYRPRPKRDPRIARLFWQGIYYGIVVGLLAGAGVWGLLMLGGAAPALATDRTRSLLTLLGCGIYGLMAAAAWVWGWYGILLMRDDALAVTGAWVAWVVRRFVRPWGAAEEEEDDEEEELQQDEEEVVEEDANDIAERLSRGLIAGFIGPPLLLTLVLARGVRPLTAAALRVMALCGLVAWTLVTVAGWRWLMAAPPAPSRAALKQAQEEAARAARWDAEFNSTLQLAVARAKRARAAGDDQRAIQILEQALRETEAQGRSVAHLQLHWMLAWLYAKTGNVDGAMVMFQTVLKLADPGSVEAREAAAALQRLSRKAANLSGAQTPLSLAPSAASQSPAKKGADSGAGSEVHNGSHR
jgi:tetratricopeptide (TPR) repeat protein